MPNLQGPRIRGLLLTALSLALTLLYPALLTAAGYKPAGDEADRALEEFFETKVRPVIVNRCLECHGAEKSKGGLRLDVARRHAQGG